MLFGTLRQMADDGRTVIFISHKLNEVTAVSDHVTVLRGGKIDRDGRDGRCDAAVARVADGRARALRRSLASRGPAAGDPVLELDDLWVAGSGSRPAARGVSLDGRGRRDRRRRRCLGERPARARRGDRRAARARTWSDPRRRARRSRGGDPRAALDAGIAFVPEDRLATGAAPGLSIASNLILRGYREQVALARPDAAASTGSASAPCG